MPGKFSWNGNLPADGDGFKRKVSAAKIFGNRFGAVKEVNDPFLLSVAKRL